MDSLKKQYQNNGITKVIHVVFKAINLNIERFEKELFNKQNAPNNGNIDIIINKYLTSNT